MWLITAAGKEKQRTILGRDSVFVEERVERADLTANLLRLTQRVARTYDNYGDNFNATKFSRRIEMDEIRRMVRSVAMK